MIKFDSGAEKHLAIEPENKIQAVYNLKIKKLRNPENLPVTPVQRFDAEKIAKGRQTGVSGEILLNDLSSRKSLRDLRKEGKKGKKGQKGKIMACSSQK